MQEKQDIDLDIDTAEDGDTNIKEEDIPNIKEDIEKEEYSKNQH